MPGYARKTVLHGGSLQIASGEIVTLIGHNGAGKTTTLNSIFGLLTPRRGKILYEEKNIAGRSTSLNVRQGISLVPQGQGIFPDLTVLENLQLGAYTLQGHDDLRGRQERVYDLFPVLHDRQAQKAGTLSGGQQRMLALGIALMLRPKLLLLDEPSLGLAPLLVHHVLERVQEINQRFGTAVLLVEQNIKQALRIASRASVMKVGQITAEEKTSALLGEENLWHLF